MVLATRIFGVATDQLLVTQHPLGLAAGGVPVAARGLPDRVEICGDTGAADDAQHRQCGLDPRQQPVGTFRNARL